MNIKDCIICFFLSFIIIPNLVSQDTLRRENGVLYLGIPLISSPNTIDGFGSADNGDFGEDYVYSYIEIDDSYNGNSLSNSKWMSYGDLLPDKFPDAIALGLGFFPDTFIWEFKIDTLFVEVKDMETTLNQYYTFIYETFEGANPGAIDSLHIEEIDGTLVEPSIIQVFPQFTSSNLSVSDESFFKITPNPSSNTSQINYSLESTSNVSISVYSSNGQQIQQLNDVPNQAGKHQISLDIVSPGIYFVQIIINNQSYTKKWIKI